MAQLLSHRSIAQGAALAPTQSMCPACGGGDLETFLNLSGMPVFNNVLWPDRTSALMAAAGDIELVLCLGCGLISNARFEPERVLYSPAYENSLHGSSIFGAWATELAERLSSDHSLAGGHVLEVGAGSGEFLSLLCGVAGCTGVGFDPSHDERDERADSQVTTGTVPAVNAAEADLVVCRHVLEHVADPVAFLRSVADAVRPRPDGGPPIYVEVPDASHMLERDAFWDVIYEHPLYFDQQALRATFHAAGLKATRSGQTFGGQFAWIEGLTHPRRDDGSTPRVDGERLLRAAAGFGERFSREIDRQQELLSAHADGLGVVIWGAGSKGVTYCNLVPAAASSFVVDVSTKKAGKRVPVTGQPIHTPQSLIGLDISLVVIMNGMYEFEIRQSLNRLGISADVVVA